jgi:hypothetical protein
MLVATVLPHPQLEHGRLKRLPREFPEQQDDPAAPKD